MQTFANQEPVAVSLFDGQIKDRQGTVIGSGVNSAGDTVYLVELPDSRTGHSEREVGVSQMENGKKWVLSVYGEELAAVAKAA